MRKAEKIMLTSAEKDALNKIAEKAGCFARSGATAGKPSFRVLLQSMAEGRFVLYDKLKPRVKKDRRRTRKQTIPGAPDWWKPWYGNAMGQDHAMKVSGLTAQGLVELGLRLEFNPFLQHPEVVVGKPEWPAPFLPSRPHWWWRPDSQSTMPVADVVATSGLTVEQLTAGGLDHDEELGLLCVPDAWKGWVSNETSPSVGANE